jgi:hypothetical protein
MSRRVNPRAPAKALDKPQLFATVENESFGEHTATVSIHVDLVTLIRIMGSRAVKNKAARAQLLGGAIVVTARHIRAKEDYQK